MILKISLIFMISGVLTAILGVGIEVISTSILYLSQRYSSRSNYIRITHKLREINVIPDLLVSIGLITLVVSTIIFLTSIIITIIKII